MDEMLKYVSSENFGKITDPNINVGLPLTLQARKSQKFISPA